MKFKKKKKKNCLNTSLLNHIHTFSNSRAKCPHGRRTSSDKERFLPFSVFSCSVSVRVKLELALLERQELRPDLVLLRPHSLTACSGDMMPSVSVSASEPTLTE